jgi:hypothetical protein
MTAFARTPVLPEVTCDGALSAHSRRWPADAALSRLDRNCALHCCARPHVLLDDLRDRRGALALMAVLVRADVGGENTDIAVCAKCGSGEEYFSEDYKMPPEFLYERITTRRPNCKGTLAEPGGAPEPRFALHGTVNWMRGLAIIVADERISYASMGQFYAGKNIQRNAGLSEPAANTVFEQLLMSLHHLSALRAMVVANSDVNLARVAVMTWYYGIYCAASAMIAAQDGSQQQDHGGTANQWDRQFAARDLVPRPFSYRLTTLVEKQAVTELASFNVDKSYQLSTRPATRSDADAACVGYLSGTRSYRQWQIEEELKTRELPKLGLSNFRSAQARTLRDSRMTGKSLGFLHQAFRYRGKANYRDALFLTIQANLATLISGYIPDLETVLRAFVSLAGAFCSCRLNPTEWQEFVDDLNGRLGLVVMPRDVWA